SAGGSKGKLEELGTALSDAVTQATGALGGPSWTPYALVGAAALVVLVGLLALFGGGAPDAEERIDEGQAEAVLEEIAQKPVGERTPADDLLRGHAHAKLGQREEAFAAYQAAAAAGSVDERMLDFVLAALEERQADAAIAMLIAWPEASVKP